VEGEDREEHRAERRVAAAGGEDRREDEEGAAEDALDRVGATPGDDPLADEGEEPVGEDTGPMY
jgi:hypothetical protein